MFGNRKNKKDEQIKSVFDHIYQQRVNFETSVGQLEEGRKRGTTMCIWSQNQLYGNVLNEKMDKYYQKFAAMEAAMAQLQNQQNNFTSMLG